MACGCGCKDKDENIPGVPTPKAGFDIMKWLPLLLVLIAIAWALFVISKGPYGSHKPVY